jgi:hypothetical protein
MIDITPHIDYTHKCPKCDSWYIPYDESVPCPSCGLVEQERFDFISKAVGACRYNLSNFESYIPPAWFVGSLGDHILHLVFPLLEIDRKYSTGQSFSILARSMLEQLEWGDQPYLRDHVYSIALRIHEELEDDSFLK